MLQPWIKILMESRLEKLDDMTWMLLEKVINLCLYEYNAFYPEFLNLEFQA